MANNTNVIIPYLVRYMLWQKLRNVFLATRKFRQAIRRRSYPVHDSDLSSDYHSRSHGSFESGTIPAEVNPSQRGGSSGAQPNSTNNNHHHKDGQHQRHHSTTMSGEPKNTGTKFALFFISFYFWCLNFEILLMISEFLQGNKSKRSDLSLLM